MSRARVFLIGAILFALLVVASYFLPTESINLDPYVVPGFFFACAVIALGSSATNLFGPEWYRSYILDQYEKIGIGLTRKDWDKWRILGGCAGNHRGANPYGIYARFAAWLNTSHFFVNRQCKTERAPLTNSALNANLPAELIHDPLYD